MGTLDKDIILKEIPLFDDLSSSEFRYIKERAEIKEYQKGDVIYKEGSPADAFYCVISGRVVIFTFDSNGKETILEYLHHGKYFGIISLLTNGSHSVTARALNDSLLLVIKKDNFDFLLKKIPKLAVDLSRTLSRRLKDKDIHQKIIFESTIISVYSSDPGAGKSIYALNLALSLSQETKKSVIIFDIAPYNKVHSLPGRLGIGDVRVFDVSTVSINNCAIIKDYIVKSRFNIDLICSHYKQDEESCLKKILRILSLLVNDYHYIILDLPSVSDNLIFSILNQSDLINILSGERQQELKNTRDLIEKLKSEFGFQEEKIKVIINEYSTSKFAVGQIPKILEKNIFATLSKIEPKYDCLPVLHSSQSQYAKTIRRIARSLGDCTVGLVLGVGVAYGFCHIGVLRVIEKERIPIDVIAGSSVGAIIASLWATGKSSEEILQITEEFKQPKHVWNLVDLTIPFLGFIKGKKLHNFFKKYLGNKTFKDLKLPLKIIACDVKKKEPHILERGSLADALMASCTMPGVFAPFKFKETFLFDGGISNPLPTEPLLKLGIKKIIAVNVTPSREDIIRQYNKIKQEFIEQPRGAKRTFSLGRYLKKVFKTNILDFIFSSIEILQSEVAKKEAQLADVVLHPDTSGLYWLELHRAAEFAARGEEEARRQLDKIWQLINE